MAQPAANFPSGMPGEPASSVPYATGGRVQATSPRGPKLKKVKVREHTRVLKPKAPAIPTAPQGPSEDALLKAAVNLRYGAKEQGYQDQLNLNTRFTAGTPTWFQNALTEINGMKNPAPTNVQAPAPTGDPAADSRAQLNAAFANQQAARGQNQNDYYGKVGAALQVMQGNTLNAANAERQGILGKIGNLADQKGDFALTYGAQQQTADTKAANDAAKIQLAAQALGLKADTYKNVQVPLAQSLVNNRAAGQRVARTNARTQGATQKETSHQHAIDNALKVNKLALDAYLKAHPNLSTKGTKGKSPFTPTQTRKSASTFRTLAGSLNENAVLKDPNRAIDALVKQKKVDPVVANAIVESIHNHGSVTRDTATLYYRATGHHLHVSPNAKKIPGDLGKVVSGFLNRLGQ